MTGAEKRLRAAESADVAAWCDDARAFYGAALVREAQLGFWLPWIRRTLRLRRCRPVGEAADRLRATLKAGNGELKELREVLPGLRSCAMSADEQDPRAEDERPVPSTHAAAERDAGLHTREAFDE